MQHLDQDIPRMPPSFDQETGHFLFVSSSQMEMSGGPLLHFQGLSKADKLKHSKWRYLWMTMGRTPATSSLSWEPGLRHVASYGMYSRCKFLETLVLLGGWRNEPIDSMRKRLKKWQTVDMTCSLTCFVQLRSTDTSQWKAPVLLPESWVRL